MNAWRPRINIVGITEAAPTLEQPYLLGLLAMIKCSICSYQCDNWYVSNWRLACHINFCLGRCPLELAQRPLRVALAWHFARRSTPFGVTIHWLNNRNIRTESQPLWYTLCFMTLRWYLLSSVWGTIWRETLKLKKKIAKFWQFLGLWEGKPLSFGNS